MKRKIFLVILVLMLTIINFILFKNFYDTKINSKQINEIKQNNYKIENNI